MQNEIKHVKKYIFLDFIFNLLKLLRNIAPFYCLSGFIAISNVKNEFFLRVNSIVPFLSIKT